MLHMSALQFYINTSSIFSHGNFPKICPQLNNVFGGEECFGVDADQNVRWRVLLGSGCREGLELKGVWTILQEEERHASV